MAIEVDNWNTTADLNVTVAGSDVDEGMLPGLINNAIRRIMAAVAAFRVQAYCKDKNVTIQASGGALPGSPAEGDFFLEY